MSAILNTCEQQTGMGTLRAADSMMLDSVVCIAINPYNTSTHMENWTPEIASGGH